MDKVDSGTVSLTLFEKHTHQASTSSDLDKKVDEVLRRVIDVTGKLETLLKETQQVRATLTKVEESVTKL